MTSIVSSKHAETFVIKDAFFMLLKWHRIRGINSLFLYLLDVFPWGLQGQQLEIKPPHFTVFHHLNHFAWKKSQAIPLNILNEIDSLGSISR